MSEEAYQYSLKFKKISPPMIIRKFKLTYDHAQKICHEVRMRQWKEAQKMMKEYLGE